jgi:hypothetical protein
MGLVGEEQSELPENSESFELSDAAESGVLG